MKLNWFTSRTKQDASTTLTINDFMIRDSKVVIHELRRHCTKKQSDQRIYEDTREVVLTKVPKGVVAFSYWYPRIIQKLIRYVQDHQLYTVSLDWKFNSDGVLIAVLKTL